MIASRIYFLGGATISKNSPHISDWPLDHIRFSAENRLSNNGALSLYVPFLFAGNKDTHGINSMRLAEVWMDEYKRLFYTHRRDLVVRYC